jgi:hypothetical protein
MSRKAWLVVIFIVTVCVTIIFGHFVWFKNNEHVALWLEGVALVLIFGLDYFNRIDEAKEQEKRHKETLQQLELLSQQVTETKRQADTASESVRLLKLQSQEQQLRELWRVLPILDDIQVQVRYWLNLFGDNKWNSVNSATKIMPTDSSSVLTQAARHSNELWNEVRDTFRKIMNADYQIDRFYAEDKPSYRNDSLRIAAHDNLKNAEPKLTRVVGEFTVFEEKERTRITSQKDA